MKTNYTLTGARSPLGGFRTEEQMITTGPLPEPEPAGCQSESSALLDQLGTAYRRLEGVREMLHTKVAELFGPTPIPDMTPMPEPEGQLGRIVNAVRSIHEQIDNIQELLSILRRL
jgi:hypothetical protein